MPKTARYTLVWSPSHQAYELHENQGSGVGEGIVPESPTWVEWVSQVSSFAFHGRNGSYTACKEHKQRGGEYWYAYARVEGKMTKRYLGRCIDLTLPRLEQAAQQLWLGRSNTRLRKGGTPVNRKTEAALVPLPVNPLLATKLLAPRSRPHVVHRPRLIQQLQRGMERALILISAPIGFGKSTLLSDWLDSRAIPVAWLLLEPQDNDPARFLSYLLAALQIADPHLGTTRPVQHRPLHLLSMEAMLTFLLNDLLKRTAITQEHVVLVLDNYQVVTLEAIHHALSFLLEHLPPWIHLVILTREDPPLPLAQLRGRDELLELRAADLRFTQEEAATFLMEVMELPLSQEESALLQARTEGWITGLQLAAFFLRGHDDPKTFITAFSGSHHYVVDFLLEEVLNRQSEAVQDFLLQTCILDRLCAPLCDAVREQDGSEALLDFLERANLFLVALDGQGKWYRYHRLFAEALRQRQLQTAPTLVPCLHLRASHWYEQQGLYDQAAFHARAASVPQPGPLVERLTMREREVLQLLLDGASNREIARHLVLSMNTVKKHVLNISRKLNARSRAQISAKARAFHLL